MTDQQTVITRLYEQLCKIIANDSACVNVTDSYKDSHMLVDLGGLKLQLYRPSPVLAGTPLTELNIYVKDAANEWLFAGTLRPCPSDPQYIHWDELYHKLRAIAKQQQEARRQEELAKIARLLDQRDAT